MSSTSPEPRPEIAAKAPDRSIFILLAMIVAYVVTRATLLWRAAVFVSFDSASFSPGHRTGSYPILSFTGDAPRPWGVPLLYTLMPTDEAAAVAQWVIATAAWATLAYALWMMLRSTSARIVGAALVLGLALTSSVFIWDFAIVSESLSFNLGILALALLMIWTRTKSWIAIAGMTVVAFWWIFTRQDTLVFVVLLLAALVGFAWRRRDLRRAATIATLVLLFGVGWSVALEPKIDKSYANWYLDHATLSEATFLYRLDFIILPDPQISSVYWNKFGMPRCAPAEKLADGRTFASRRFREAVLSCPDLWAWIATDGGGSGVRYALDEPVHWIQTVFRIMPETISGVAPGFDVATPVRLIPDQVNNVFFPPHRATLPVTGGLVILALAVLAWARAFRRRAWLITAGLALVATSLASIAVTLMFSAGDYERFGIQESVFLRIGLILLAVAALDAGLTRTRERAAVAALDATTPAGPAEEVTTPPDPSATDEPDTLADPPRPEPEVDGDGVQPAGEGEPSVESAAAPRGGDPVEEDHLDDVVAS